MNKSKQTILMMKIIWMGNIFSKGIYSMIAYNTYLAKEKALSNSWEMPLPVFIIMGICSAVTGIVICRSLMGKIPSLKQLAIKLVTSNQSNTASGILNFYLIGLGAIETVALFGLVGFIQSLNITFYLIMVTTTVISWTLANPFVKKQNIYK